jgi:hypothetical protein
MENEEALYSFVALETLEGFIARNPLSRSLAADSELLQNMKTIPCAQIQARRASAQLRTETYRYHLLTRSLRCSLLITFGILLASPFE